MTAGTGDAQTRIRDLRAETIAAVEQRDLLAAEARRALIAAWEAGEICRDGCADALTGWGLEPPPGELTMSADGQMSYTRMHTDEDEAREEAWHHVPDELYRLLPEVTVWPTRVVEVALIPGEDDYPEVHPYRITVQVRLRTSVTAASQAAAITDAQTMVNARLPELADADVTLTGLTWHVYDGPDDLIHTAGTDAQPATVRLPGASDDLAAAIEARDAATGALADLRRKIRHRAVHALATEEIGGEYEETAERVERFLLDLGFDRLPRAYSVTVTADMTVRVRAATAYEAYGRVRDLMESTGGPHERRRPWTAQGWGTADLGEVDGSWRVTWRHVYDVWLRDQPDRAAAATAGEALIRGELDRALAGVEHHTVLTCAVEGYGIDQRLDPDTD
ncbi:hypothetical protein KIF24_16990 [Micromonospora sp. Llam7]|uniref:hypothetical protein n=1 Tax=Micromonospora tarapacensis TaxID=2835305 RepID=UPI001C836DD7|nr:hypothetical protein [Micromonospora tarapacensis]MBX7267560.1 hypothetical protein [Micromonospora tarapacensis]